MPDNNNILAGKKLKFIRLSLLLSRKTVSEITGIPTTTLARMEEGIQPYPIDELEKLCAFYAYKRDDLYIESKPIPDWRRLRSKIISAHKLDKKVHNALLSKPRPVLALEFRVLQTDFLNTYQKVGEIRNFIIKVSKWDKKIKLCAPARAALHDSCSRIIMANLTKVRAGNSLYP